MALRPLALLPMYHNRFAMTATPDIKKFVLTPALLMLMAVTTGIAVASNYYAQPLLHTLALYFDISETAASFIVTVAQLSYALGLILLVPLGDIFERKRMIIIMMTLSTAGLVVCTVAPGLLALLIGTAVAALFSVVAQVLVPYAATLADPASRGKAVGTVMSGLLLGILLARTCAGVISYIGGWRLVYAIAALLMLGITIALALRLPPYPASIKIAYPRLIISIFDLFKTYPQLRLRSLLGAFTFAIFSVLWTPLAFLLGGQYHYSDLTIGLFGLAGAAGVLIAPLSGRLADKGQSARITTLSLLLLLASWAIIYFGSVSVIVLLAGILFSNIATQSVHIINMSEIFKLQPDARNRLNAGYMFTYFLGGTFGTLISALAYQHHGWAGVAILGSALSVVALIIWLLAQKNRPA